MKRFWRGDTPATLILQPTTAQLKLSQRRGMEVDDKPRDVDLWAVCGGVVLWWPINTSLFWWFVETIGSPVIGRPMLPTLLIVGLAALLARFFWRIQPRLSYGIICGYGLVALTTSGTGVWMPISIVPGARLDGAAHREWVVSVAPLLYLYAVLLISYAIARWTRYE
jgi:hypothetical protein